MQLSVALMLLMPSAALASGTMSEGTVADNSVKVEKKGSVADVRTVTGTVYDAATNQPMAGVRVQATGHKRVTTMTDGEGKYKLNIPSYVTLLTFSTPDYLLVQKPVGKRDIINVRLHSDDFQQNYSNDIVITAERGFEEGITTVQSIDSEIQNKLGADVRAINRSGTLGVGAAMFIRGINSLNANTQPLVVVDGVIWDLQESNETIHMGAYNNVLSAIDVNDIRSIKVFKNGAAIYGARAANGVIIINTKRGESMATRITANIYGGVTLEPKTPGMLSGEVYCRVLLLQQNSCNIPNPYNASLNTLEWNLLQFADICIVLEEDTHIIHTAHNIILTKAVPYGTLNIRYFKFICRQHLRYE